MVSADAQGHHLLQLEGQRVEVESTVLVQNELAGALGESSSDAMKIVLLLQELGLDRVLLRGVNRETCGVTVVCAAGGVRRG